MARPLLLGSETPRIFTPPLRELTEETTLGFEVIEFARIFLGIVLWPWQKWLLIHALELNEDGSYRFRRVLVLVARQNGKSQLAAVLAAWWLFVDSDRHPDRVPPIKFKITGTAQNLDIASQPWRSVKAWCDPKPPGGSDDPDVVASLQSATLAVRDANGKEEIVGVNKAHYQVRAAPAVRGKPNARVLMDELREQKTWEAWNAVSPTIKNVWSAQLWMLSNAGDIHAVVLAKQREGALKARAHWAQYVEGGLMDAEEYANQFDVSLGIFEWSAPEGCAKDDPSGILQANPSIGHGAMTVKSCISDIDGMTDAGYRTEILCQWVTSRVEVHLDQKKWAECAEPPRMAPTGELVERGAVLPADSPLVIGVDVSEDRLMSYVSVAGFLDDGRVFGEVVAMRAGMMWVEEVVLAVAKQQGSQFVALQSKGSPSSEFVDIFKRAGLTVIEIAGSALGSSAGRIQDRVRDQSFVHRAQPILDMAVSGAATRQLNEVRVWDRKGSPIDIAPIVSISNAVYGLETLPEDDVVMSAYEEHGLLFV